MVFLVFFLFFSLGQFFLVICCTWLHFGFTLASLGFWRLASGVWRLASGFWLLAFGFGFT